MRSMIFCIAVLLACWALCPAAFGGDDFTVGTFINSKADAVEARAGLRLDANWEAGLFGQYFTKDEHVWAVGGYGKLTINPDATLPVKGWFPQIGEWVGLPDTIPCSTYMIGKGGAMPAEKGVDLFLGVGVGASAGPFCLEWIYRLIESGTADRPVLSSGAELSFGLRFAV